VRRAVSLAPELWAARAASASAVIFEQMGAPAAPVSGQAAALLVRSWALAAEAATAAPALPAAGAAAAVWADTAAGLALTMLRHALAAEAAVRSRLARTHHCQKQQG